jgi:small basic protein
MVVGVLVVGDAVVCIAKGVCTPSGLSRKTTSLNLMCSIDRLLKGGLRVYLERVFNICASLSSFARVALFCKRC